MEKYESVQRKEYVLLSGFINNLLFWSAVKILVEIVQFLVKVSGFFLGKLIGFL